MNDRQIVETCEAAHRLERRVADLERSLRDAKRGRDEARAIVCDLIQQLHGDAETVEYDEKPWMR